MNAHCVQWGYPKSDSRGEQVEDFIAANSLVLHNDTVQGPTFETCSGKGWPDLTLSSTNASTFLKNWKILDEENNSDHKFIHFEIDLTFSSTSTKRFHITESGIKKFKNLLAKEKTSILNGINYCRDRNQLNEISSNFFSVIQIPKISQQSFKIRAPRNKFTANWWTKELRAERNKTKALRRKIKSTLDDNSRNAACVRYNEEQRRIYKKKIMEAKINLVWKKFCSQNKDTYGILHKLATRKFFVPTKITLSQQRSRKQQQEYS
ncbi:uncharacterized protein LOC118179445 [Stegodyphus dumicola]|uniref:uncharacterized protein LOC118179445 n=1 Tax=Stegodyphus dumicola TaxID=202533 RepID=UPI0015B35E99|nr:uncharacterized protein LOC118179445 [Stegodyphus dumicola]